MLDRAFGATGRRTSPLGLGTWAMGGDEWGPSDDQQSLEVLRRGVERGIRLIDTADVYGLGRSEELIGEAVPPGSDVMIVTKGGWDIYTEPAVVGGARRRYDREYLEMAFAGSCRRLRRSAIDVYLLHNPTVEDLAAGEGLATLRSLQDRRLVDLVGVSVGSRMDAVAAIDAGIDVLEVPFNVIRNWARFVLPAAKERGVAVIAREPFERGLLTGRYGPDATFPAGDHRNGKGRDWLLAAQPHVERLKHVAAQRGSSAAEVALAYPLAYPEVSTVIAGARSVEQLEANIAAAGEQLSVAEAALLETPGAVDEA